jgi:membrane-bound ClpP family serine protease
LLGLCWSGEMIFRKLLTFFELLLIAFGIVFYVLAELNPKSSFISLGAPIVACLLGLVLFYFFQKYIPKPNLPIKVALHLFAILGFISMSVSSSILFR